MTTIMATTTTRTTTIDTDRDNNWRGCRGGAAIAAAATACRCPGADVVPSCDGTLHQFLVETPFAAANASRFENDDDDNNSDRQQRTVVVSVVAAVAPRPPVGRSSANGDYDDSDYDDSEYYYYASLLRSIVVRAVLGDREQQGDSAGVVGGRRRSVLLDENNNRNRTTTTTTQQPQLQQRALLRNAYLLYRGKPLTSSKLRDMMTTKTKTSEALNSGDGGGCCVGVVRSYYVQLRLRLLGGIDRQNRVGSKFGGGGVSSAQQSERERKERLKQLALESIDLAKDPYLVKSHLGSYECKLCLTLHRDEANYLAHTQGKKHQAGLARRAHLEKIKQEREGKYEPGVSSADNDDSSKPFGTMSAAALGGPARKRVKIGRPAYQVFKSRDPDTNQRCLSFELQFPEISDGIQPRHRFMSAFEQRVDTPPDRRYQYLLFAADPYETVAFKIPNDSIDKGENRFVTHWDADAKKFTVSLFFVDPTAAAEDAK